MVQQQLDGPQRSQALFQLDDYKSYKDSGHVKVEKDPAGQTVMRVKNHHPVTGEAKEDFIVPVTVKSVLEELTKIEEQIEMLTNGREQFQALLNDLTALDASTKKKAAKKK